MKNFIVCNSNFVHFLEEIKSKIFFHTLFFVFNFIYLGGKWVKDKPGNGDLILNSFYNNS